MNAARQLAARPTVKERGQMTGRVEGKVAFITGAARGQGRSHAVRLAQEGADIIAVDLCDQVDSVPYPMATPEDLADTVKQVEALDRRIVATQADVRDYGAVKQALDDGVAQLGRLDIVSANAGIASFGRAEELPEQTWQDMIDTNLTGVWHAAKAAIPHLIAGGRGGSIVLTSSAAGLKAYANVAHYVSAKHGVVGLMRTLALELAPHMIRVNSLHPTQVDTDMIMKPGHSESHDRGFRARLAGHERAAHPVGRAGRHQQCPAVPGLGRGPLHHRRHAAGRRRDRDQVARGSRRKSDRDDQGRQERK
jgi:(+)-trans-carveol dehydrogenase